MPRRKIHPIFIKKYMLSRMPRRAELWRLAHKFVVLPVGLYSIALNTDQFSLATYLIIHKLDGFFSI